MMNNELEGMWKEVVVAQSVGSPAEHLKWCLQHSGQKCYRLSQMIMSFDATLDKQLRKRR
jgi:hypothetical protein